MMQLKKWQRPNDEWVPLYISDEFQIHPEGRVRYSDSGDPVRSIVRSGATYVQLDYGTKTGFYDLPTLMLTTWPKPKTPEDHISGDVYADKYDWAGSNAIDNLYWTTEKNVYLRSSRWAEPMFYLPCMTIAPGSYSKQTFESIMDAAKNFGLDPVDVGEWCKNDMEVFGWVWGL